MIISMGLGMAIRNSRTLAEKFATKNPHGKTETGATSRAEILFKISYGQNSAGSLNLNLEIRLLLSLVILSMPRYVFACL